MSQPSNGTGFRRESTMAAHQLGSRQSNAYRLRDWYAVSNAEEAALSATEEIRLSVAYHSECGDHRLHERHWVSVHWCRQAGQTPPVSKVFHSLPQVQNHLSSLRGDQPQSGQRIRGPDGSWLLSRSGSRSTTESHVRSVSLTKACASRSLLEGTCAQLGHSAH